MSETVALVVPVSTTGIAIQGGAEGLYDGLESALKDAGLDVQRIGIEFDERTWDPIPQAYQRAYQLDLSHFDWVLSTKPPTHMIRHPRHVVYLLHPIRVFYDRWNGTLPENKALIQTLDRKAFEAIPTERRYCIGQTVAERMQQHLGLDFKVLHPAPPFAEFQPGPYEYFFTCSRLHEWKRMDLLVKAMKHYRGRRQLLIAGEGTEKRNLEQLAAGDERIRLLGFVSQDQLVQLYRNALAVPFVPIEEDFGYVAIEAGLAQKPVITCKDSGEPARWIVPDRTGLIVEPDPKAIAWAFDHFDHQETEAIRMGRAARIRAEQLSWSQVVETLSAASRVQAKTPVVSHRKIPTGKRLKILCTDNQVLLPAIGGGRVRNFYLLKALSEHYDVHYIGMYDWGAPQCVFETQEINPHFKMTLVPATLKHLAMDGEIRSKVGEIVFDVTFPKLGIHTPKFHRTLNRLAEDCRILICTHPWASPFLPETANRILIYDAHNCEYEIKRQILEKTRGRAGKRLLSEVREVEGQLCRNAHRIFVCSETDGKRFMELYGISQSRFGMVPNGVAVEEYTVVKSDHKPALRKLLGLSTGQMAVFMGSGYAPNTEAVEWIAQNLAPKLPEVQFVIVGSVCDTYKDQVNRTVASGRRLKTIFAHSPIPDNLRLWGIASPEDKVKLLAAADVAINPMFRGSGSNMKMLDFMAAGLPTLTTSMGARGIELKDGVESRIIEPERFTEALKEMLGNAHQRDTMGARARETVQKAYSWGKIAEAATEQIEAAIRDIQS